MASEELQEELEALTCSELIRKLHGLFESEQEDDVDECLDWFLFTYSPEHAYALVQSNSDSLRDGLFLNITMTKVRDIYEPEIFLESLNIISCLEGYEQDIAKAGAVRATLMMMSRDIHNPRSQVLGCKVLANLAHDLEVCKWVGKVKGISKLLEVLKRHVETPDVVVEVCRTLTNLAFRCTQNKEIMINEKAIESILAAISSDKGNERLINAGLRAIRNIVNECDDYNLEETLVAQVMDAMADFPMALEIQINGIWILVNLMSCRVDVKRRVVDRGIIDHILTGMETNELDPHVQLAGSTALALLSKMAAYRQVIARKGGIQLLIVALRMHRQIVPIQRAVIKAIFRLSFNEQNRTKLGDLKIVSEIIESMKANYHSGPFQRIAILCLLQLAKSPKLREVIQTKAVSYIIQARNKFSDVPHIYRVASSAVEAMVSAKASPVASVPKTPLTKETEFLHAELQNLQEKLSEKDDTLKQLQASIEMLDIEVVKLKEGFSQDLLSEVLQKVSYKKDLVKLKQQKTNLSKELKKSQGESVEVSFQLESLQSQLKEDDKKQNNPQRKYKPEKKDLTGGEKKKTGKQASLKKGAKDKDKEKDKNSSPNKQTKRNGPQKTPKTAKSVKTRNPEKGQEQNQEVQESDQIGETHSSLGGYSQEQFPGLDPSPRPPTKQVYGGVETPGNETAKPPGGGGGGSGVSPHPPNLTSRPSLRNINRKLSCSMNTPVMMSNEELEQLNLQIEEIQKKLAETEKYLETCHQEKEKVDAQVNKLNTDLNGHHILIQTLQKESLNQTHNREKLVTGNSFFTRHQKKLKSIKDQISTLEKENEELKKEISSLGGGDGQGGMTVGGGGKEDKLERSGSSQGSVPSATLSKDEKLERSGSGTMKRKKKH